MTRKIEKVILLSCILGWGCTTTKFRKANEAKRDPPASSPQPASAQSTIYISAEQNGAIGAPFTVQLGNVDLKFDRFLISETGVTQNKNLAFYVVVDRSTTMIPYLAALKTGLVSFARDLQQRKFTARFGAVTFRDPVDQTLSLTDSQSLVNFVTNINTNESSGDFNSDMVEGALGAVQEAARRLRTEETRSDAIRAMILITDIFGHNGGSSANTANRDCSTAASVNSLMNPSPIMFFYSVSSQSYDEPCAGFTRGDEQYGQVLAAMQQQQAQGTVGAHLAWPFSPDTLSQQLLPNLSLSKDEARKCVAQTASVTFPDGAKIDWRPDGANTSEALIPGLLDGAKLKQYAGQDLLFAVQRCCDATPPAGTGVCKDQRTQQVRFKVVN